ncbi:class I SAM-dependent methyltransferase [Cyanobium sp. BA5m-21]|uniref:methyltransferase domain-containing protein n=2 Tax=Cyanobium TaxID=167375 RepID=UPI0020CE1108|nr:MULTISPECIES: class I SAM-dependent methyltransferase [unclassified Cyanobium]MCP9904516.1 class I SAM-dependent methyltransferase [Cyanobium sp. BA5m-10]MCP9905574.1 class I SAM-dependent methyltransferase [Cyanobium sp. BA5m-21]
MEILSHGHREPEPSAATDPEALRLRSALGQFELGRFLLDNRGLNGHWTSYVLLFPDRGRQTNLSSDGTPLSELESWLLNRCPIILATQERFRIAQTVTQQQLRAGMALASLPCGLMDDLLSLDYTKHEGLELTGIDLDPEALSEAENRCNTLRLPVAAAFEHRDAWQLGSTERWDLLTSNGLNIYVQEDDRCVDFYRQVSQALRADGIFVISFITPPEQWQPRQASDLEHQRFLFQKVIPPRWNCFREESQMRQHLQDAGFAVVAVHHDEQRMFPTVVARKY